MKKFFVTAWVLLTLLLGTLFAVQLYNYNEILQNLRSNFVAISLDNDQVTYSITHIKPKTWISKPGRNNIAAYAIQISEDWNFFQHHGVDFEQIFETLWDYIFCNKRIRGASTITQQVVKNLFLGPEKTLLRKFKEIILALYLDAELPKERILEIYLNIIEYGRGLYGIGPASQFYFSKNFEQITPREGAFLAMLLPNPKRHAQSFRQKQLTPYARRIIGSILYKLKLVRMISSDEFQNALVYPFHWETPQANSSPTEKSAI